jgi:hypothetical protein
MWIVVFWVVTPCGLIAAYQHFGGTYPFIFCVENGGDKFIQNASKEDQMGGACSTHLGKLEIMQIV